MESKLKAQAMDQSGEVYENLLLRESGYPHLPDPVFVPAPKADAWNDAGTKPDHPCLCETKGDIGTDLFFQYFDGDAFLFCSDTKESARAIESYSNFQHVQWREVQP